jgi:hypothetical protein
MGPEGGGFLSVEPQGGTSPAIIVGLCTVLPPSPAPSNTLATRTPHHTTMTLQARPFTAASRPPHCRSVQVSCSLKQHAQTSFKQAGAALLASAALMASSAPAWADLNELEAEAGGEFGRGSAMQFGEADVQGKDFSSQVCGCPPPIGPPPFEQPEQRAARRRRHAACGTVWRPQPRRRRWPPQPFGRAPQGAAAAACRRRRTCAAPTSRRRTRAAPTSGAPTCRGPTS